MITKVKSILNIEITSYKDNHTLFIKYLPLILTEVYLCCAYILYAIGPWVWPFRADRLTLFFILGCNLFFFFGYIFIGWFEKKLSCITILAISPSSVLWVCCIVSILVYYPFCMQYTGNWYPPIIGVLSDAHTQYLFTQGQAKIATIFEKLHSFFNIFVFSVFPLTFYYWDKLSNKLRIVSSTISFIYLLIYVSTGRTMPVALFFASSFGMYLLIICSNSFNQKRRFISTLVFVFSISLTITMFQLNMDARVNHTESADELLLATELLYPDLTEKDDEMFNIFTDENNDVSLQVTRQHIANYEMIKSEIPGYYTDPVAMTYVNPNDYLFKHLPSNLKFVYIAGSNYLTNGYHGLTIALHMRHQWTYGMGHSPFLLSYSNKLFGANISERTYEQRMLKIDPPIIRDSVWKTSYVPMANDLTFVGVIIFMAIAGAILRLLWVDALNGKNIFAILLVYIFIIAICCLPSAPFMTAGGGYFVNFYGMIFLWIFSRLFPIIFKKW